MYPKKEDNLFLTCSFEIELAKEQEKSCDGISHEELLNISKEYSRQYSVLTHIIYNIIYKDKDNLQPARFYVNDEKSPCFEKINNLFHMEKMSKKAIEYAIYDAYAMVKSDIEKITLHKQQVEDWKDELKKIDKKIYNTIRCGTTANRLHRLKKYYHKKSVLQSKIDKPFDPKRTFGSKSLRKRIEKCIHSKLVRKQNELARAEFVEAKKKDKYLIFSEFKKKFSSVTLTEDEMTEAIAERNTLKEEYNHKRYGQFKAQGDARCFGNRFFRIQKEISSNGFIKYYLLFCPNRKTHIRFLINTENGYKETLDKLYELSHVCQIPLTFTLNIYEKTVNITYDPIILYGKEKWEKIQPKPKRIASGDLNPNDFGFVIADFYGRNGFRVICAEVYSIEELNKLDSELDGNGIPSNSPERIHITNKRHYEIDIICKTVMRIASHYHCEIFALENLTIKSKNQNKGKDFNKKVNKYWCRTRFVSNIKRECILNKIQYVEQPSYYSSFIGNFLYRTLDLPDMCLAALEIGRRAYRWSVVYRGKKKTDIPEEEREDVAFPALEDFGEIIAESKKEFSSTLLEKKCLDDQPDADSRDRLKRLYKAMGTQMVRVRVDFLLNEKKIGTVSRLHTPKSLTVRIQFPAGRGLCIKNL